MPRLFYSEVLELAERANSADNMRGLQGILGALRGPDMTLPLNDASGSLSLKWYTTARIRAVVTPSYQGDVNVTRLTASQIIRRDELLRRCSSPHFASHYREAAYAICNLYGYDLLSETSRNPPAHGI